MIEKRLINILFWKDSDMRAKSNSWLENIVVIFIFVIVLSISGLGRYSGYAQVVTYSMLPLACYGSLILNKYQIHVFKNPLFLLYFFFLAWAIFTTFFAVNFESALASIRTLAMVLMCIFLVSQCLYYKNKDFLIVFLVSIISGHIITTTVMLPSAELDAIYETARQFDLNANHFAYNVVFSLMAALFVDRFYHNKYTIIVIWVVFILGVYTAFIIKSRQLLIVIIPLMVFYFFLTNQNRKTKYLSLIGLVIISVIGLVYFENLQETILFKRYEYHSIRKDLALDGIKIFYENPLTGVGPNQYLEHSNIGSAFTHNTYTEAAANFGAPGLGILLLIYLLPLNYIRKKLAVSGQLVISKTDWFILITYLFYLLYNNFYVFYLYPNAMILLTMFVVITQKLYYQANRMKRMKSPSIGDTVIGRASFEKTQRLKSLRP